MDKFRIILFLLGVTLIAALDTPTTVLTAGSRVTTATVDGHGSPGLPDLSNLWHQASSLRQLLADSPPKPILGAASDLACAKATPHLSAVGGFVGSQVATALTVQEGAPAAARKVREEVRSFTTHAQAQTLRQEDTDTAVALMVLGDGTLHITAEVVEDDTTLPATTITLQSKRVTAVTGYVMAATGSDGGEEAAPAAFPPELDVKLSIDNDTLTIALPAYTYAEGGSYKAILQLVTSELPTHPKACCSTEGRLAESKTVCRADTGCRMAGQCDGRRADCPASTHKPDGTLCTWYPRTSPAAADVKEGSQRRFKASPAQASRIIGPAAAFYDKDGWLMCKGRCDDGKCSLKREYPKCCIVPSKEANPVYKDAYERSSRQVGTAQSSWYGHDFYCWS